MDKVFDKPIVLDERYFGETPDIKELFEIYSRFRQKYINFTKFNINVSKDPDLKLFCNKACQIWGLNSMSYAIIQSPRINSFTLGIDYNCDLPMDLDKTVEYGPNGIKFKEKYKVNIFVAVFTGLFLDAKFTDRECFAVFLHEVGHNFQCVINKRTGIIPFIKWPCFIIDIYRTVLRILSGDPNSFQRILSLIISSSNQSVGALNKALMTLKTHPVLGPMYDAISLLASIPGCISAIINSLAAPIVVPMMAISSIMEFLGDAIFRLVVDPIHYANEQTADSFASDLGFGKDSASFQLKISRSGLSIGAYKHVPVVNALVDLWLLPFWTIIYTFDPHPMDGARVIDTVHDLTYELENGYYDPKMKKALEKDLADTKRAIKEYEEQTKKISLENKQIFTQLFTIMLIDQLDGGIKYNILKPILNQYEEKEKTYKRITGMKEGYSFLDDIEIK